MIKHYNKLSIRDKKLLPYAIALLIIGIIAVFALYTRTNISQPASLLYVQQARGGTFQAIGGDTYSLTLKDVWPQTTYFSDRPDRISGSINTEAFVELNGMFTSDNPPNAAVVLNDSVDRNNDVVVVELSNPEYDSSKGTLTYTATLLDEVSEGLSNWDQHNDASLPANFSRVSVYIDNSTTGTDDCSTIYSYADSNIDATVTDGSGQPVSGAEVNLFATGGNIAYKTADTDSTGKVSFSKIDPTNGLIQGYYKVTASKSGYEQASINTYACPDQTANVDLTLNKN